MYFYCIMDIITINGQTAAYLELAILKISVIFFTTTKIKKIWPEN